MCGLRAMLTRAESLCDASSTGSRSAPQRLVNALAAQPLRITPAGLDAVAGCARDFDDVPPWTCFPLPAGGAYSEAPALDTARASSRRL
jgi:hypothetical protein